MTRPRADICIIGGGIIGTSAATFLAEAGASVVLFERDRLAGAASGRNSGSMQHPFDPVLARLHVETLALYRDLAARVPGFKLPTEPAGLLLLSQDEGALARAAAAVELRAPELLPQVLAPTQAQRQEPALAPGLAACLLATGYPVQPAAATLAFARRAERAGVRIETGEPATPDIDGGRVAGVRLESGARVSCSQVLVAAGPWTPALIPGWAARPPIRSVWGVVVSVTLDAPPRHVLEELGIDEPGAVVPSLFSLMTAGGSSSVGSTFLDAEPDPEAIAQVLIGRAAGFVPAVRNARPAGVRACARPQSFDGRPFVGQVEGVEGLYVCAGHGPWGISTGPASAALVCQQMLEVAESSVPDGVVHELSPLRVDRRPS